MIRIKKHILLIFQVIFGITLFMLWILDFFYGNQLIVALLHVIFAIFSFLGWIDNETPKTKWHYFWLLSIIIAVVGLLFDIYNL